jgi:glycosyltransferase involved in cell wall biosynthesis
MNSDKVAGAALISVITVVYNAAKQLENTIKSVINQSSSNLNFIIIDGGSTDGTIDVIKKYEKYIHYWVSEPDAGIYDAMNKGWAFAEPNSYILFLGAGDLLLNLPVSGSFKKSEIIAGRVQVGSKMVYQPKVDFRLKLGNTLHHQALMIKKSIYLSPPFDLHYPTYADFDFNQRLFKAGHKIYIDPFFKSYALDGGVSTKFDKNQSLKIVEQNFGIVLRFIASCYYLLRNEV